MRILLMLYMFFFLGYCGVRSDDAPCYRPEIPVGSYIIPVQSIYQSGEGVRYRCGGGGLSFVGDHHFHTCDNGTWDGIPPLCLPTDIYCKGTKTSETQCVEVTYYEKVWSKPVCEDNSNPLVLTDDSMLNSTRDLLVKTRKTSAWIAAHSKKMWQWSSDSSEIRVTDWAANEPSNLRGNENRIQLRQHADYQWNDAAGDDKYEQVEGWSVNKYICQFDERCDVSKFSPNPHTEIEGSCYVLTAKDIHDKHDGRCVSWNEERPGLSNPNFWKTYCKDRGISWYDANNKCKTSGGKLAELNTKAKIDAMRKFIIAIVVTQNERKFAGNYWIGGELVGGQREWTWGSNNGTSSALPTPSFSGAVCGAVTDLGDVIAEPCDKQLPTLCIREISNRSQPCGVPPQSPHTKPLNSSSTYSLGDSVQQECMDGYITVTQNTCECLDTGLWDAQCSQSVICQRIEATTTAKTRTARTARTTTTKMTTARTTSITTTTKSTSQPVTTSIVTIPTSVNPGSIATTTLNGVGVSSTGNTATTGATPSPPVVVSNNNTQTGPDTINNSAFLAAPQNQPSSMNSMPRYWWYVIGGGGLLLICVIVCTALLVRHRRRGRIPEHLVEVSRQSPEFTTCENPMFRVEDPQTIPAGTSITSYKGDRPFRSHQP